MADQGSSQEKTEEATPKRLREARKKGQVAKSRDVDTVIQLIAAFMTLFFMWGYIAERLKKLMQESFQVATRPDLSLDFVLIFIGQAFGTFGKIIAPFLLVMTIVALVSGFFQVGPIFSGEPMKPQFKRLNIVENLKNKFKMTTLIELLKNIAKLTLIFFIAYYVISASLRDVVLSVTATLDQTLTIASKVLSSFLIKIFIVFIAVALIDLFVQRWQYKKQMRMSKEEVKREYKQDEGDPLIKSQRRRLHEELAMSDTKKAVGMSDAVITNPTHLAIAIKYDDKEMAAPTIMAKGQRLFADAIREFAETQNVPIIQNPPLAWTLIELEIGDEIPAEMYQAVAELLVQVYSLKQNKIEQAS